MTAIDDATILRLSKENMDLRNQIQFLNNKLREANEMLATGSALCRHESAQKALAKKECEELREVVADIMGIVMHCNVALACSEIVKKEIASCSPNTEAKK